MTEEEKQNLREDKAKTLTAVYEDAKIVLGKIDNALKEIAPQDGAYDVGKMFDLVVMYAELKRLFIEYATIQSQPIIPFPSGGVVLTPKQKT